MPRSTPTPDGNRRMPITSAQQAGRLCHVATLLGVETIEMLDALSYMLGDVDTLPTFASRHGGQSVAA